MTLTRFEAIQSLSLPEVRKRHNYSLEEMQSLENRELSVLINEIYESIDLDDPYYVIDNFVRILKGDKYAN